ncbi:MAG: polyamine aminopropyltransferase, partial [Desulfobulbaceae bacterium]|nr:polyamine aminopropyltransferase [Desulfobulbaceae bacterium]
MFVMGGCGLAYEYTMSRVASDLLGNSVRQWAIIIGVMMFFMGIGSDAQKYLKESRLIDKFILAEIVLGLLGGFGPIAMMYTFGVYPNYYILVQYAFISIIGLLIGFEIPLLIRINQAYTSELKMNLGGVLKMDYIGALCGALVWVFLLPKFFTLIESAFVLGLLNVAVGGFTLYYFRRLAEWKTRLSFFTMCCIISLGYGLVMAQNWTSHAEQHLYRDKILFSETTPYQHIVITESRSNDIYCYINGHLQFSSADEFIYHENLIHPAFSIAPRHNKVLILGGGDGMALREVLKYQDVESVVLCDIDPMMTRLARNNSYFNKLNNNSLADSRLTVIQNHALDESGEERLLVSDQRTRFQDRTEESAKVKIINMDAARFVEQISGMYDIIIMDFPDPSTPELAKLYSTLFYHHIAKKLSADGIMVQQSTSPIHAKEAFLCIGRTMAESGLSVIPYHDNIPSFGEWGWWIGGRDSRYSKESIRQLIENIDNFEVMTKYLTPELVNASVQFGKNQLFTEADDINVLADSRLYDYYLTAWKRRY